VQTAVALLVKTVARLMAGSLRIVEPCAMPAAVLTSGGTLIKP
jgi:hypothetical protein